MCCRKRLSSGSASKRIALFDRCSRCQGWIGGGGACAHPTAPPSDASSAKPATRNQGGRGGPGRPFWRVPFIAHPFIRPPRSPQASAAHRAAPIARRLALESPRPMSMSEGTTYLILDIETIPDRELFTPPEPAAGVERPFPAALCLSPDRARRDVARREPGVQAHRHLRRGQGRGRHDVRLRRLHGQVEAKPGDLERPRFRSAGAGAACVAPRAAVRLVLPRRRLPLSLQRRRSPRPVRRAVGSRRREDDLARRRGARDRPARQGRGRREPGRGALSRGPDRVAATLLPVRRRADRVPVPALSAGRGRHRSRPLPPRGRWPAGDARDRRPLRTAARGRGSAAAPAGGAT